MVKDTSLCGLGAAAPNPILSTLHWFRDEYAAHVLEHRCLSGACAMHEWPVSKWTGGLAPWNSPARPEGEAC
jgi:hypothetical protein